MRNGKWLRLLGMLAAISMFAAACSDSEEPTQRDCGEGTVLQGNACVAIPVDQCGDGTRYDEATDSCVPDSTIECGAGTVEFEGRCVPESDLQCGPGTRPVNGECVLDEGGCGPGTRLDDDGVCVPSPDSCGEGTVFDEGLERCIPESVLTCGEGTIAHDGVCQPVLTVAEELAANADLDEEVGTVLTTPDIGERFVFTGLIDTPKDGGTEQKIGRFTFEAEAGQWFRVAVFSLGLPAPAFTVTTDIEDVDYERWSPTGIQAAPNRHIVIPADGEYTINVLPSILLESPNVGIIGESDWAYVAYLEQIEAPEARPLALDGDTVDGTVIALPLNYYEVTNLGEGQEILVATGDIGHNATALLQVWSDEQTLVSTRTLNANQVFSVESPGESMRLLVDFNRARGMELGYELGVETLVYMEPNEVVEQEHVLEPGEFILIGHDNLSSVSMRMSISEGEEVLTSTTSASPRDNLSAGYLYWYSHQGGTYTVKFENSRTTEVRGFRPFVRVEPAHDLGTLNPGDEVSFSTERPVARKASEFFVFTSDEAITLSGTVSNASGDPEVYAHSAKEFSTSSIWSSTSSGTTETLSGRTLEADTYVLRVMAFSALNPAIELDLQAEAAPVIYEFEDVHTANPGEIIFVRQTNDNSRTLRASLLEDGEVVIDDVSLSTTGSLRWYSAEGGQYTIKVWDTARNGDMNTAVVIETVVPTPMATFPFEHERLDSMPTGERNFFVLNLATDQLVTGTLTANASGDPELLILEPDGPLTQLHSHTAWGNETISRIMEAGTYIFDIYAFSTLTEGYTLAIDVEDPPVPFEYEEIYTAAPGEIIRIAQTNDRSRALRLSLLKDGETLIDDVTRSTSGHTQWFSLEGGEYTVRLWDTAANGPMGTVVTVDSIVPTAITTFPFTHNRSETMSSGAIDYFRIDFAEAWHLNGTLMANGTGDPDLRIRATDGPMTEIAAHTSSGSESIDRTLQAGSYIVAINASSTLNAGYTLQLDTDEPLIPFEYETTYEADAGDIIRVRQTNNRSRTLRASIIEAGVTVLDDVALSTSGDVRWFTAEGGEYTVRVWDSEANGSMNTTVTVDSIVTTPIAALPYEHVVSDAVPSNASVYYAITVTETTKVAGTVTRSGASGDPEVYIRQGGALTQVFASTSSGAVESFETTLAPGTYIIEVFAWSELVGGFTLGLVSIPPPPGTYFPSTSGPHHIPDNDFTGVNDTITVSGCGTVGEIRVETDITHTYIGDLYITLTGPDDTVVILHNMTGGATDHRVGVYPDTLPAAESLAAFEGKAADGDWTFHVSDRGAILSGTLNSWGLYIECE